jgi:hypothetical protein
MPNSNRSIKYLPLVALISLPAWLICLPSCISREYAVTQNYEETAYRTEYYTEPSSENISTAGAETEVYELLPYYYWYSQEMLFKDTRNLWYYGYDLPELPGGSGARLKIYMWPQLQYEQMFLSVFDMTRAGHLDYPDPVGPSGNAEKGLVEWSWISGSATSTWLDWANERMTHAKFLGGRSNVWSRPGDVQLIDLAAGRARTIAIIISGPRDKWNANFTLKVTTHGAVENKQPAGEKKIARQVPYQMQKQRTVYELRQAPFWEAFFPQ